MNQRVVTTNNNPNGAGAAVLRWLAVPPIVAGFTVGIVRLLGGGVGGEIDLSVWAMVWVLFLILTLLYVLLVVRNFNAALVPTEALAQGIILCPLALAYGARMFEWLGVILAVGGAVALLVEYNQSKPDATPLLPSIENDISQIPSKFVITDDGGMIVAVSNEMLEILDAQKENVVNKLISDYFSPVGRSVEINEKFFDITRKAVDNGKRYYFELKEKGLPTGNENEDGDNSEPAFKMHDPETSLFTRQYAMNRIEDEIYRTGRYKHEMSAVLLRLMFPTLLPDEDVKKYVEPFNAFCKAVKKDTRFSDTAFEVDDMQILIVLSECTAPDAEAVVERLLAIPNALQPSYPVFANTTILSVTNSLDGVAGDAMPTAHDFVEDLRQAMTRKYSAQALADADDE